MELCVQHPEPIRFLSNEFRASELRTFLKARTGESIDSATSSEVLAAALLKKIFPSAPIPQGLSRAFKALHTAKSKIARSDDAAAIRGTIVEFGCIIEFLLRLLLRFVYMEVFRRPPEIVLVQHKLLNADQSLKKSTLGSLLYFVQQLGKLLADPSSLGHAPQQRLQVLDIDVSRLCPTNFSEVAGKRNKLAHYDKLINSLTGNADVVRAQAAEFFDSAERLLKYYKGTSEADRLFPHVITIKEVKIDRWRRRTILAESDSGKKELLFTTKAVQPGEVYLMHPHSNPVRVDPILVPAGVLVNPASRVD